MNEYERVIEEASRLNRSITVAQRLEAKFLKYLLITAVVTSLLTSAIIFGVFYYSSDPDLPERVDRTVQQDAKVLGALVCILSVPPDERTREDTRYCLQETGLRFDDIPLPPDAGQYPEARSGSADRPEEGSRRNTNSNSGGGTEDPAPKPSPSNEPSPDPTPIVCVTVLDRSQCIGG